MQQLLEQARQKDEKIRALETAVINQPALGGSPSPTPPITPPQRPSQSSNDSASQDEIVEDQASSQNSFNSGFSPGGSQQEFSSVFRSILVMFVVEHGGGLCHCVDHQPIPAGQDFVVALWPNPLITDIQ